MVEILKLMLDQISSSESRPRFVFELVIRTQPSGPLCLWQCLYDIWHDKIFSVYWTSTVHWLDLQITRFQSIAISALRRSSRRVYFLLVGLADHCGPTSMSPCIGKDLLSSISHTTVELPG